MSKKKEPKQKKERSKKDWRDRRDFLKLLLVWWEQVHPAPVKGTKRYMNTLRKHIAIAEEEAA